MPTGMPASGGSGSPLAACASTRAASASARSFGQAQVNIQARIHPRDAVIVAGRQICRLGRAAGNSGAQFGQSLWLFHKIFGCFHFAGQWSFPLFEPRSLTTLNCAKVWVPHIWRSFIAPNAG
jgi:hypothetical protein